MASNPQVMGVLSRHVLAVQRLYDVVFELKKIRAQVEALGIPQMTDDLLAESTIGDLSHIDAGKERRLLAAMDVLDVAFLTPVSLDGTLMPPVKALVDVIR